MGSRTPTSGASSQDRLLCKAVRSLPSELSDALVDTELAAGVYACDGTGGSAGCVVASGTDGTHKAAGVTDTSTPPVHSSHEPTSDAPTPTQLYTSTRRRIFHHAARPTMPSTTGTPRTRTHSVGKLKKRGTSGVHVGAVPVRVDGCPRVALQEK